MWWKSPSQANIATSFFINSHCCEISPKNKSSENEVKSKIQQHFKKIWVFFSFKNGFCNKIFLKTNWGQNFVEIGHQKIVH
jgi:hypothetical protein